MPQGWCVVSPRVVGNVLKSRLRGLVAKSGKTARALSIEATGKPDTIRDILRDKTQNPRSDTLQKIAAKLGTDMAYLTGAPAVRKPTGKSPATDGLVAARVVGSVQAGAFMEVRAATAYHDDTEYVASVRDRDFPNLIPVAFRVVGDSINKRCENGGYAICLPFAETGLQLKDGMWVVAERQIGDLVERTVKEVRQFGRRFELHPASTNPQHKPIKFPSADPSEEVRVVALVRRFIGPDLPF